MNKLLYGLFAVGYFLQPDFSLAQSVQKAETVPITNSQCFQTIDDITVVSFKGEDVRLTSQNGYVLLEYGKPGSGCKQINLTGGHTIFNSGDPKFYLTFKDKPALVVSGNILEPTYKDDHTVIIKKNK